MEAKFYVLGARGSFTTCGKEFSVYGGYTTCFALKYGDYVVLIDCGSGISAKKEIFEGVKKVDILFTHLHYDHIMGILEGGVLPVLPNVYSTFSKWGGTKSLKSLSKAPFWPVNLAINSYCDVKTEEEILLGENISAVFYESNHPNYGNVIKLTVDGHSIMIMVDYEHGKEMNPDICADCDILVYDGMFTDEEYENYKGWGHSTVEKGIEFAKKCRAKQLVITHHAPQKNDETLGKLEEKYKKQMKNLVFAKSGLEFKL